MNVKYRILSKNFYLRATELVARELLGKILLRRLPNNKILSGKIVETEAYLGVHDRACHTYQNKQTTKTAAMYLDGGCSYVYLIYGMYDCFNVVTEKSGVPEAVLIRALEPLDGIEEMKRNRKKNMIKELCSGPGKLCQALKITRELNGHLLTQAPLLISDSDEIISSNEIVARPRIGVDYAGEDSKRLLRFYIRGNPYISKK